MTQKDPIDSTGALAGRRDFLRRTTVAGAALIAPVLPRTPTVGEALSYEEFLAEAVPLARRLVSHTERFGEDAYLFALAALAVRLRGVDEPELRRVNAAGLPAHWIGANDTPPDCPFTVLHWKLEPHGVVRPHPHTYGNVVTLGLEGEVRICNHETVAPADYAATTSFLLRRTNDQMLRRHDINLVPLHHGFIHGFVAGAEGARGLDITTRVRPKQPNFSVAIGAEPRDPARALFEGSWVRGS
ncbi:MAG: twin-arginine translocation signal domain-containing protein [Planctomycetes bacterium]|nr:twin-arginine translocation signal domain-containing protein [Planctomycetota bacterium]